MIKRGHIVKIEFDDHAEHTVRPFHFVVFGRVVQVTDTAITVDSWANKNPNRKADNNIQRYTILRAFTTKITRLVEAT